MRWIGGIIRCEKGPSVNHHNHPLHGAMKIAQCVKQRIHEAAKANPELTPMQVATGTGIGYVPSAVDSASSHLGKIARELKKGKSVLGINDKQWSPCDFESVADSIDGEDSLLSGENKQKYTQYGRPYLVSAGIENSIKYIFTMSPIMTRVATSADFIQCDVTYYESREYPYLFNAVAINHTIMQ